MLAATDNDGAGLAGVGLMDGVINDPFGAREVTAQQLAAEGVSLSDVPGTTYID